MKEPVIGYIVDQAAKKPLVHVVTCYCSSSFFAFFFFFFFPFCSFTLSTLSVSLCTFVSLCYSGNPTRDCLEKALASSENAKYGLVFSTGLAATLAAFHAFLKAGDHVICGEDCYGGTGRMLRNSIEPFGVEVSFVDGRSVEAVASAVKPGKTKLIWLESPTNPSLRLSDIEAIAKRAKAISSEVIFAVDNTFMSPYLQQPLDLGADLTMHSLTKYINGHSDVLMGAIMTNDEKLHEKLKFMQNGEYFIATQIMSIVVRVCVYITNEPSSSQ